MSRTKVPKSYDSVKLKVDNPTILFVDWLRMQGTQLRFKVLGLAGRAGAGKNAVADILTRLYKMRQASFAEALREEISGVTLRFGRIPHEIVCDPRLEELAQLLIQAKRTVTPGESVAVGNVVQTGPDKTGMDPWEKPTNATMRRILQLWGTEFRRVQDYDYWVKQICIDGPTVITDVRFPNEQNVTDEIWYIRRPLIEGIAVTHSSEQQITPEMCDHVLFNQGSMEDLEDQVKAAASYRLIAPMFAA